MPIVTPYMSAGAAKDRSVRPEGNLPNTSDLSGVSREERRSAKRIAQFLKEQYEKGLVMRRPHAKSWIGVNSIMAGYHYYRFNLGTYEILEPPREGSRNVRAVLPVMSPLYRWELGRLGATQIGITTLPVSGAGADVFAMATRGQLIMDAWSEEAELDEHDDQINQHLLYYGMAATYVYADNMRKTVRLRSIPGTEIFPIPYDATHVDHGDGFMHWSWASKAWLERQDEMMERELGAGRFKRMADYAETSTVGFRDVSPTIGMGHLGGGRSDGALVGNCWIRPNPQNPDGEWMLMVGDELFRYQSGHDEKGESNVFPRGRDPLHLTYYTKKPNDFWGCGFCEELIGPQREANRQLSSIVRSALDNRELTLFNTSNVQIDDIQDDEAMYIPFQSSGYDQKVPPAIRLPAQQVTREVGSVLQVALDAAKRAAGHESGILYGQAEGRVEGGPATSIMNINAQTPLQPVLDRKKRMYQRVFPVVLDKLRETWGESRTIQVLGRARMAKEAKIARDQVPWSHQVRVDPSPMVAGGRHTMLQLLFSMKEMRSDDGSGTEIKSHEFRKALMMQGMVPPGIDVSDEAEDRIRQRIELLINDGQTPAIRPSAGPIARYEDHRLAIELLKPVILDPSFDLYGAAVKQSLVVELDFHMQSLDGHHRMVNIFDEGVDAVQARNMEQELYAMELDPDLAVDTHMV